MANIREAPIIARSSDVPRLIRIHHPDYDDDENTLLGLYALEEGDGLDYDTALASCSIVTGNTSTGFFTSFERRHEPVARPDDGILREDDYFFQLPDSDVLQRPYPVIPRFDDWSFPHKALPPPWNDYRKAVRDAPAGSCCITDCMWAIEQAHIVPLSASDWWSREGLPQYALTERFSDNPIDAAANMIPLRGDMHIVFNDKVFAIVPKRDDGGQAADLSLAVHVIHPHPDPYFNDTFHNQRLLPLSCSTEYLFARFAWTIFSPLLLGEFFERCFTERHLLVRDLTTRKLTVETRDPDQLRALVAAQRDPPADEYGTPNSEMDDSSPGDDQSDWSDSFSPGRGRSRKRQRAS
ncbi:hypothetical protein QBC39DRAFT_256152 [Podospora conica]|nr:hypothetical protein QBC39DRAFT_256152 [Schizothecium conicum]